MADIFDLAFQQLISSIYAGANMRGGVNTEKVKRFMVIWATARENPDLMAFLFVIGFFSGVVLCVAIFIFGIAPVLVGLLVIGVFLKLMKMI
jgi:hypothetical protein